MAKHGKRYRNLKETVDSATKYVLAEALTKVKAMKSAKFEESLDVAIRLNVNPKYADQMIRSAVVLPNGTGKTVRVLVFAKGEKETEAKEAGADFVGGEDLVEKIKGGWLDFDKVIATPDMMAQVGKIGKILGPRGLMPNPKVGSVTFDISKTVGEMKAGRVEFRVDKAGIIHSSIGRVGFSEDQIKENLLELVGTLVKLRPASVKGTYILGIALSPTMGPSVRVDVPSVQEELQ